MAGYSKIFLIGELGGFEGVDGINSISLEILVGEGNRQWLEVVYFDKNIKSIGHINKIIPEEPNNENMLLDACIAFFPDYFKDCSNIKNIKDKLSNFSILDFDLEKDQIPKEWFLLREEARSYFEKLNIFAAEILPYNNK